ncbi:phage holin family protein [Paenibacillus alkaliterrae]|uniref:phage holin family protein n=1 Tax=Paenibacillus alkaliterrae TaxID=320909 RepID=UPI001F21C54A|nr:phage holin family protein [Paenibacillus alkaliterrae]MCF2938968.1 phage holin family protein [Paenibacillus alkaliterrae]
MKAPEIYAYLLYGMEALYGEGRLLLITILIAAIALDWITGIAAAHLGGRQALEYGKLGVLRTLFILLLPMFSKLLDTMLSMPGLFFYAVTIGLIYRVWQSITANAYHAGWDRWIPRLVIQHIEAELKAKAEQVFIKDNCKKEEDLY